MQNLRDWKSPDILYIELCLSIELSVEWRQAEGKTSNAWLADMSLPRGIAPTKGPRQIGHLGLVSRIPSKQTIHTKCRHGNIAISMFCCRVSRQMQQSLLTPSSLAGGWYGSQPNTWHVYFSDKQKWRASWLDLDGTRCCDEKFLSMDRSREDERHGIDKFRSIHSMCDHALHALVPTVIANISFCLSRSSSACAELLTWCKSRSYWANRQYRLQQSFNCKKPQAENQLPMHAVVFSWHIMYMRNWPFAHQYEEGKRKVLCCGSEKHWWHQ